MFSQSDLEQLNKLGMNIKTVESQIENFKTGFPFVKLNRAATLGDGIHQLDENTISQLNTDYAANTANLKTLKFVPASGAASRMFKNLFAFAHGDAPTADVIDVLKNIDSFAFGQKLKSLLASKNVTIHSDSTEDSRILANYILAEEGLNYGYLPKGLIIFHEYPSGNRTAFEEHLVEAAEYVCGADNVARLHFTVSPEHKSTIEAHINETKVTYEKQFGITFDISFSIQHPSTDTIAVNPDNTPFRENGDILFRPGGHGALIENLNELESDIIFIKNIDNVVPDSLKKTTYDYKKALGSKLIDIRKSVFEVLRLLENNQGFDEAVELAHSLGLTLTDAETHASLMEKFNRPIRVCGMVKNEGEPGGGPFWIKDSSGRISLQIIESSQIDSSNAEQKDIMEHATHFNPVDLVCSITDYQGNAFDLHDFIDPETGFITYKSRGGREVKAQELPGLWNGAMAKWITLFIEVPMVTFNPVKTVNDLLRKEHQA